MLANIALIESIFASLTSLCLRLTLEFFRYSTKKPIPTPVQIPFIFCNNYQRTPLECPLILWRINRDFLAPKLALCDRPGRGDNSQDCRLFRPFKSLLFSVIIIKGHRLVSFDIMAEKSGFPRTKACALRQAGAGRQFTGLSPFPPVQIPFIFCNNYQRTPLGCPLILWRRNRDLNPSYAINVLLP